MRGITLSSFSSLFRIGVIIAIIGIAWTGFEFYQADKVSETFELKSEKTETVQVQLKGKDLGFYKVSVPELGDTFLVRVLDSKSNIIADKRIETKSSVNYFEFESTGEEEEGGSEYYTLQVTNLAGHDFAAVNVEFGDTNASKMKYSGLMILGGMFLVVIASYQRLRYGYNYSMAQPDEKS